MPTMDGFELYNKIREKDSQVKICFLTAIATFNEEFRRTHFRVNRIIAEECFIHKPILTEFLIRKVIDIININMITMHI
jgi:two-component SAPR family response regulator